MEMQMYWVRENRENMGKHRIGAVYVAKTDEGKFARGVSICSVEDVFDAKKAKKIALARVRRAIGTKKNSDKVIQLHISMHRFLKADNNPFKEATLPIYLSAYDVELTDFEKRMMDVR